MRTSHLLILTTFLFIPTLLFAQEEDQNLSPKQVGLTYSTLGGSGIHYLLPINNQDNIKFAGILMYREEDSSKDSFYSIGVEYQRDLVEDETKRAYFTAGTHLDNKFSDTIYFGNQYDGESTSFFSLGVGFGFDFGRTSKGIVLNALVTYQFTKGMGNTDRTRIGLGGGVGLGFNF